MAKVAIPQPKPRRTFNGEGPWVQLLAQVGPSALRMAFIESGVTPPVAGNLVWFLEDQQMLNRTQTPKTRTRYRQQLADLDITQVSGVAETFRANHETADNVQSDENSPSVAA